MTETASQLIMWALIIGLIAGIVLGLAWPTPQRRTDKPHPVDGPNGLIVTRDEVLR